MIDPEEAARRKSKAEGEFDAPATEHGELHDLLVALGFRARERVSINTAEPGGRFVSTLYEVHELAGWTCRPTAMSGSG